jgi:hypothetical protein
MGGRVMRFRNAAFLSFGISGGAITLFVALQPFMGFSEAARELLTHWHTWTRASWVWVAKLIGSPVPDWVAGPLTVGVFLLLAMLGISDTRLDVDMPSFTLSVRLGSWSLWAPFSLSCIRWN